MRMPEQGSQTDRPDLAVLPPATALGRVWRIGPAQASIIVGPGCRGGRHQVHPPPIPGCQRCGMHHGGGPQQYGGIQYTPAGHTHLGE